MRKQLNIKEIEQRILNPKLNQSIEAETKLIDTIGSFNYPLKPQNPHIKDIPLKDNMSLFNSKDISIHFRYESIKLKSNSFIKKLIKRKIHKPDQSKEKEDVGQEIKESKRAPTSHDDYKECSSTKRLWNELWSEYSSSFSLDEIEVYNSLEGLIMGANLYKKSTIANSRVFDPLNSVKYPPDRCGYGVRYISISIDLKSLIIKQSKEGKNFYKIDLETIRKPKVSKETTELLKEKEKGDVNYYPFYLELTDGDKLELIATSSNTLKAWLIGLNTLLNKKEIIQKFREYICLI